MTRRSAQPPEGGAGGRRRDPRADAGADLFSTLLIDRRHLRSDLMLVERAVRERWPMPMASRRVLLDRLDGVLHGDHGSLNFRVLRRVARVVLAMQQVTIEDQHEDNG